MPGIGLFGIGRSLRDAAIAADLAEVNINVITDENKDIHVSGHPSRDELIEMYSFINPKISIPVHGTREHIDAHATLALECQVPNVIKPKNGDIIKLNGNKPKVIARNLFTSNVSDAGEIVSIDDERFTLRRHALWNGYVSISIVLTKDCFLACPPKIDQVGVSNNLLMDEFLINCSLIIEDYIENNSHQSNLNDLELINKISRLMRKEFKSTFLKRPNFSVHINRI